MKNTANIIFALILPLAVAGQDAAFSQFYNDRALLNPALAGLDEGLAFSAQFREQWFVNWPNRFQTMAVCAECRMERPGTGLALILAKDREGGGALTTFQGGGSVAQTVQIVENSAVHLGLTASYAEKYVDYGRLIFSDQISPFATQLDPSLVNLPASMAEIPEKAVFASVGGGAVWRGEIPLYARGAISKNPFLSLGGALHHTSLLVRPEESLLGETTVLLPLRWALHAGLTLPMPKDWAGSKVRYWNWTLLAKIQRQGHLASYALGAASLLNDWGVTLLVSRGHRFFSARNANAVVIAVSREWKMGEKKTVLKADISYDIPTGHVGTQTGGVLEMSLRLRFAEACQIHKKSTKPSKKVKCPRPNNGPTTRWH